MTQCRNCQNPLEGVFCPNCGQKDIDLERPTHQLIGEVLRESFDVDGRAFRTFRALIRHPGYLTSEFLAGRRRSFTSPVRLYLLISISFFVLVSWLASEGVLLMPEAGLGIDAASQARFISDLLPRLMFVLLPVFALLLKIVFPGRLLFDHAIFSIHFHSVAYVTLAFQLPLEKVADEHWLPMLAQVVLFGYLLSYFVISIRRVYHAGWIVAIAKSMAIFVVYLMIFVVVVGVTGDLHLLDN
jgi:hypothetical protein